ncbi:MAG: serine/threonine protein kinase, partial [Fimbriiglobus sp.]|nr:serine/threonine protein kinase [Fimbriiglobus sp.]
MNAAPPPTSLTREEFLAGVRVSGVLSDRQWDRAVGSLTVFQKSAREVAEFLVKGDWLTRFQAERLLQGKADGFILGSYVLTDYLTRTNSGRVYKAKHRTMNRAVSVLLLRAELTATDRVRQAIQAQARAAARLAHPNVLTLLDVNTWGGRMYLVHEYMDGTDLGHLVQVEGPLGVARACEFTRQAALGLQHAHEKQTTHGLLNPKSLLVGRPGGNGPPSKPVVKVSGLGLGQFTVDGSTEGFLAPELAITQTPTPAADVYSLGGVLHFLLTGLAPHPAVPLGTLRRDMPAPLAAIISALLSADPADRPTIAATTNALAAFATDDSAFVDFSLPTCGTSSKSTLSATSASHPNLPLAIPLPGPSQYP